MRPDLSILVPVYDEAATVERALDALLEADLGLKREVLVVDDGSTDGTGTLLRERSWPQGTRLLRHEHRARSTEEGKKLVAGDGVRMLRTRVRCRLEPLLGPR